jgi:hypothetical protein
VSLEFPNIRTEYWRVIKDIKDVLGIKINSISLGALILLTWSFKKFPIGTADFYADVENPSIISTVEKILCISSLPEYHSIAILEPIK